MASNRYYRPHCNAGLAGCTPPSSTRNQQTGPRNREILYVYPWKARKKIIRQPKEALALRKGFITSKLARVLPMGFQTKTRHS
eukprot:1133649-Pelagomonas_calceolata.AAC.1